VSPPRIEKPRGPRPRGSRNNGHYDDDLVRVYRTGATLTDLEGARARREAAEFITELRTLLETLDLGLVDLEAFAWAVASVGASLGARAARGALRRAS
jgi:hypothetical protein